MSETHIREDEFPHGVHRLREEQKKVVSGCEEQIQHWTKVEADYSSLQERLRTLPDKLSYDIMVPFGPLAFMPGKLVHTNEVTVLLGDNWFAKCSAKQAVGLAEHRKSHVRKTLDDLGKVAENFEARVGFTEDLRKYSGGGKGNYVDIREEVRDGEETLTKGKRRLAHKPNSMPRVESVLELPEEEEEEEEAGGGAGGRRGVLSEEELWARLDQLQAQEDQLDDEDRASDGAEVNGEDATSSSSSEEEKDGEAGRLTNGLHSDEGWPSESRPSESRAELQPLPPQAHGAGLPNLLQEEEEEEEEDGEGGVPTIYFSHTMEPKKVRINTGRNTMLKFSERKEEAKRKKKNGSHHGNGHGHSHHELHKIKSPADFYRVFVDVVNGELVPRKSILKSRSRENSVCSDTSESSAADFEERRGLGRSLSHDEGTHSDTSEGILEEESPTGPRAPHLPFHYEAFSGTVVEKDPGMPTSIPHLTICAPALPTIPERKCEDPAPDGPQGPPKRVSKFKASRAKATM